MHGPSPEPDAPDDALLEEQRRLRAQIGRVRDDILAALQHEQRARQLREAEFRRKADRARREEIAARARARIAERTARRLARRATSRAAAAEARAEELRRKRDAELERAAEVQARADLARLHATSWGDGSWLRAQADLTAEALPPHREPSPPASPARAVPVAFVDLLDADEGADEGVVPTRSQTEPDARAATDERSARRGRSRMQVVALDVEALNAELGRR
jgi:hypothetical protein